MPIWYETEEQLRAAVARLDALGPAAKRLLGEAVAAQEFTGRTHTPTVEALLCAGLVHVSDPDHWTKAVTIRPSLWGEEALDALEAAQKNESGTGMSRGPDNISADTPAARPRRKGRHGCKA